MLAMIPFVLISNASLPPADVRELIAAAKAKPGSIAFGHGGNATAMHLSGELLKIMAGIDLTSVPYKGSGPVATDVLGGQLPLGVVDLPSAISNVKAGKLRALAVTSSRRVSVAPEIPTFAEAGVPGYESIGWFGAVAPARTPAPIIERLNAEMAAALAAPDVRERMLAAGVEPLTDTPQEFAAFIHAENRKWARVIKSAKIKVE
jgi:tripartite-type tricarboxylate transporter receptor subunit TctC